MMKDLDTRRQIYDLNAAIGGHNYILLTAQMLGLIDIEQRPNQAGNCVPVRSLGIIPLPPKRRDQEIFKMGACKSGLFERRYGV